MATRIEGNKTLRRTIEVYGIGEVQAALNAEGITFKVKRTKIGVTATWPDLVRASHPPEITPQRFEKDAYGFLQWQAEQLAKRRTKRLTKQIAMEIKNRLRT